MFDSLRGMTHAIMPRRHGPMVPRKRLVGSLQRICGSGNGGSFRDQTDLFPYGGVLRVFVVRRFAHACVTIASVGRLCRRQEGNRFW